MWEIYKSGVADLNLAVGDLKVAGRKLILKAGMRGDNRNWNVWVGGGGGLWEIQIANGGGGCPKIFRTNPPPPPTHIWNWNSPDDNVEINSIRLTIFWIYSYLHFQIRWFHSVVNTILIMLLDWFQMRTKLAQTNSKLEREIAANKQLSQKLVSGPITSAKWHCNLTYVWHFEVESVSLIH